MVFFPPRQGVAPSPTSTSGHSRVPACDVQLLHSVPAQYKNESHHAPSCQMSTKDERACHGEPSRCVCVCVEWWHGLWLGEREADCEGSLQWSFFPPLLSSVEARFGLVQNGWLVHRHAARARVGAGFGSLTSLLDSPETLMQTSCYGYVFRNPPGYGQEAHRGKKTAVTSSSLCPLSECARARGSHQPNRQAGQTPTSRAV